MTSRWLVAGNRIQDLLFPGQWITPSTQVAHICDDWCRGRRYGCPYVITARKPVIADAELPRCLQCLVQAICVVPELRRVAWLFLHVCKRSSSVFQRVHAQATGKVNAISTAYPSNTLSQPGWQPVSYHRAVREYNNGVERRHDGNEILWEVTTVRYIKLTQV